MNRLTVKYILLIISLFSILIYSQEEYQVRYLANDPQIPSNLIKSIQRDKEGYVWIASDAGLIRCDGKNVTLFNKQFKRNRYVKNLFVKNDTLFVLADEGIFYLLKVNGEHKVFPYLVSSTELNDTSVFYPKNAFKDKNGNFWFSEPVSIIKIIKNKIKRYNFPSSDHSLSYVKSFNFAEDEKGTLLLTSQRGNLFFYNHKKDLFQSIPILNPIKSSFDAFLITQDNEIFVGGSLGLFKVFIEEDYSFAKLEKISDLAKVSSIIEYKKGELLIGTWTSGLYKYDLENKNLRKISELKFRNITNLSVCQENVIWVSSDEGLAYLYKNYFWNILLSTNSYFIHSLIKTKSNKILASEGLGVFEIQANGDDLLSKNIFNTQRGIIRSLEGEPEDLWIGLDNGTLINYKKSITKEINLAQQPSGRNIIRCLAKDENGDIWATQDRFKGIFRIDKNYKVHFYDSTKGIKSFISAIKISPKGDFIIAGIGKNYLYKFDKENDSFVDISLPFSFEVEESFIIYDFEFDSKGNIWIVSNSGLLKYSDNKIELIKQIGEKEQKRFKSIGVDSKDNIWLGLEYGLIFYHSSGYSVIINDAKILDNLSMTFACLVVDDQDRVVSGSASGLIYYKDNFNFSLKTPTPHFTLIESEGKSLNKNENIVLPHNSNLNINFVSLSFPNDLIFYQYRIKNLSDGWSAPKLKSEIFLTNLPAGNHKIEIRALRLGNDWSDIAEFSFAVEKPFYLSTSALVFYLFLVAFLILLILIILKEKKERFKLSEQLNNFFKTSQNFLLITDTRGKILFINKYGLDFLDFSKKDINKNFVELFTNEMKTLIEDELKKCLSKNRSTFFIANIFDKDNNEFVFQWSVNLSSSADKFFISGNDITNIKRYETQLKENIEELQELSNQLSIKNKELIKLNEKVTQSERVLAELNANKDKFFSIIAHDLRGPFTGLLGLSEILISSYDDLDKIDQLNYLRKLNSSLRNLFNLLKNLLDWTRLQQDVFTFEPEIVNVREIVNQILQLFAHQSEEKGININCNISADLEVFADRMMFKSILNNLISNAIKFTKSGGSVIIMSRELENKMTEIAIKDNGIGMSDELQSKLFKISEKVSRKGTGEEESTGLGLILCKDFIEKHGGTIRVESKENVGTTFYITLPSANKI